MRAALKSWGKSLSLVLLMLMSAYACGYFFTRGAEAAGGLVTINIERVVYEDTP